jgi:hypothetical protein
VAPWSLEPTAARPCGGPVPDLFPDLSGRSAMMTTVAQRVRMSTAVSSCTCNLNLRPGHTREVILRPNRRFWNELLC